MLHESCPCQDTVHKSRPSIDFSEKRRTNSASFFVQGFKVTCATLLRGVSKTTAKQTHVHIEPALQKLIRRTTRLYGFPRG
jgi:hypothetical protein